MRRVARLGGGVLLSVIAGLLGAVLFVTTPAQAVSTSVVAPGGPSPINILPSVVVGSKIATTSPEALTIMMMQWMKNPAFWKAAQAVQTTTATAAQTATVAAEAATFVAPATKFATLSKVIGGASAPLSSLSMGLSIGQGASRLVGFKDDQVCSQQNGILTAISAITNGVDCTAFNNQLSQAQRNIDQLSTNTGPKTCIGTFCVQLLGMVPYDSTKFNLCFKVTGSVPAAGAGLNGVYANGGQAVGSGANNIAYPTGYQACSTSTGLSPQSSYWFAGFQTAPIASYSISSGNSPNVVTSPVAVTATTKPNPQRTFQCVVATTDGGSYTGISPAFTETDAVLPSPKCPAVPATKVPATTTIKEVTPGAPDQTILPSTPTTPEYQGWKTTYPECSTGTCMLDLRRADTGTSCFSDPVPCADWFGSPTKNDDYQCFYGTHSVVLTECTTYAPTFKPDAVSSGEQLGNPETGDAGGVQTGPNADGDAAVRDANGLCYPNGWGVFNPLEWVLKPLKCAFIPEPDEVQNAQDQLQETWNGSTPGKLAEALSVFSFTSPGAGCQGLAVPMPLPDDQGHAVIHTEYYLPACPGDFFYPWAGPMSLFIGGSVCIAGFFTARKLLGSIVGYGEAS